MKLEIPLFIRTENSMGKNKPHARMKSSGKYLGWDEIQSTPIFETNDPNKMQE
jgi:hypothetical protein